MPRAANITLASLSFFLQANRRADTKRIWNRVKTMKKKKKKWGKKGEGVNGVRTRKGCSTVKCRKTFSTFLRINRKGFGFSERRVNATFTTRTDPKKIDASLSSKVNSTRRNWHRLMWRIKNKKITIEKLFTKIFVFFNEKNKPLEDRPA